MLEVLRVDLTDRSLGVLDVVVNDERVDAPRRVRPGARLGCVNDDIGVDDRSGDGDNSLSLLLSSASRVFTLLRCRRGVLRGVGLILEMVVDEVVACGDGEAVRRGRPRPFFTADDIVVIVEVEVSGMELNFTGSRLINRRRG
jgi:hypothetical protein